MKCERLSHVWPILRNVSSVEGFCGIISCYDCAGWEANALPILVSFSHQSANPSRDLRHSAINHFQRILLSPQTLQEATTPQVYVVFEQAIFPLIQELLDSDVHLRDPHPQGMPETRMKASALLCRVFLYYLDRLTPDPEAFTKLWLQVLDFLNGLMHIDHRHQLVSIINVRVKHIPLRPFGLPASCLAGFPCLIIPHSVRSRPRIAQECPTCHEHFRCSTPAIRVTTRGRRGYLTNR